MNSNRASNKSSTPNLCPIPTSLLNTTKLHKRPSTATRAFTAFGLKRTNDSLRRPSTSGHMMDSTDQQQQQHLPMRRPQPITIIETAKPRTDYTDDDCDFSFMATPSRSNYIPIPAPRLTKRKWNPFRLTELAGMMGISPQTTIQSQDMPQEIMQENCGTNLEKKTVFVDDDTALQSSTSPRPRTALKELCDYHIGSASACENSLYNRGNTTPSVISDEYANSHHSSRSTLHPIIKIRPEYDTLYKKTQTDGRNTQNVVCVISVEMPSRRGAGEEEAEGSDHDSCIRTKSLRVVSVASQFADRMESTEEGALKTTKRSSRFVQSRVNTVGKTDSLIDAQDQDDEVEAFSFSATPSALLLEPINPFVSIIDDLRKRVADWKGHSVDRFGPLLLYDFLGVQQDSTVREFYVYLFKEALLCVAEERKKEKNLAKLTGSDRGSHYGQIKEEQNSSQGGMVVALSNEGKKAALKLKGRIWLRHIRQCEESEGDLDVHRLNIKLEDENLDQFVLCFKEKGLRSVWRGRLTELLEEQRNASRASRKQSMRDVPLPPIPQEGAHSQENASRLGTGKRRDTDASNSGHSTYSGKAAGYNGPPLSPTLQPHSPVGLTLVSPSATSMRTSKSAENLSGSAYEYSLKSSTRSKRDSTYSKTCHFQQWSASGGLDPRLPLPDLLPHNAIDLVIMISVPSETFVTPFPSLCTTAAVKLQLIKSTLEFVVAHMASFDRVALIAYSSGIQGSVRRTSLLSISKVSSRDALDTFIESLGKSWNGPGKDPYLEDMSRLGGNGDRIDTVTAVNIGFDIVLQRKSKNPVTSMILITDVSESTHRGQMDLVLARAEAACVPVHCFGFGKSHDPSSLWLLSNHTKGSYTFIKEWSQLRECVTGCIGSIMSVALTQVKVHISVPSDNHFQIRKVAGSTGAIISSNGKNVDLELGEIRFGDRKELFVEMELDFTGLVYKLNVDREEDDIPDSNRRKVVSDHYERGSATDDFVQRLGLQSLNLTPSMNIGLPTPAESLDDAIFERKTIEEVAVFQVDCGYKDINTGSTIIRLPTPSVLTLEIDANSLNPLEETQSVGMATALADPIVTRRRLEILVSDMISRCLLLVSRRNQVQALTLLIETRRIVETVLQAIPNRLERQSPSVFTHLVGKRNNAPRASQGKRQKEILHGKTVNSLLAMLDDLDVLIEGLESNKQLSFDRIERNFGAQQAMALRDQRAWTSRTNTEYQFFKMIDNAAPFAALAASQAYSDRNQSF